MQRQYNVPVMSERLYNAAQCRELDRIAIEEGGVSGFELMCRASGRPVPSWSVPDAVLGLAARAGDLLARLGGGRAPLDTESLAKLRDSAWYDPSKAERELGYVARRSLEDALRAMAGSPGQPR